MAQKVIFDKVLISIDEEGSNFEFRVNQETDKILRDADTYNKRYIVLIKIIEEDTNE